MRLLLPSEAANGMADVIRVRSATPRAQLLVEEPAIDDDYWRPPGRTLLLRSPQREEHLLRGVPVGVRTWRFAGVPEGTFEVALYDGYVVSDFVPVSIGPGTGSLAKVKYDRILAVSIEVVDVRGNEVFDVNVSVIPERPRGRGLSLPVKTTEAHSEGGRKLRVRTGFGLRPGWYTVSGTKPGVGSGLAEVELLEGRTTPVKLVLVGG